MVHEIEALHLRPGNLVVLAHIERYLPYRRNAVWLSVLRGAGVLMQCNAVFFLSWRTRRKAMRMLKRGEIDFLGSDCHNMNNRTPELGDALTVIGEEGRQIIAKNISRLLSGWEADVT